MSVDQSEESPLEGREVPGELQSRVLVALSEWRLVLALAILAVILMVVKSTLQEAERQEAAVRGSTEATREAGPVAHQALEE